MTREEQINVVAVSNGLEFRNNLIKESVSEDIARMYSNIAITYFEKGAKYADRTMIDKACKWLEENLLNYWSQINANNTDDFIENFRKIMEK
jgi:hypothetical protein